MRGIVRHPFLDARQHFRRHANYRALRPATLKPENAWHSDTDPSRGRQGHLKLGGDFGQRVHGCLGGHALFLQRLLPPLGDAAALKSIRYPIKLCEYVTQPNEERHGDSDYSAHNPVALVFRHLRLLLQRPLAHP